MTEIFAIEMTNEVVEPAIRLDDRAIRAKDSGDEMESLLREYEAFLRTRALRYAARFSEDRRDELYNTARLALYEAVRKYDAGKGHFFPFADRVIRVRIIDENRKLLKQNITIVPLEEEDDERASTQSAVIVEISKREYEQTLDQSALADEIEQFKQELATWGITMATLVKQSPKHSKLREECRNAIERICASPDILHTIQVKRYFPVKAIMKISGIPQKKLERVRSFLLASVIIKVGNYDFLSEYVNDGR